MSATPFPHHEHYLRELESGPAIPQETRKLALERFLSSGLPQKRQESWRHTDVGPFFSAPFALLKAGPQNSPLDLSQARAPFTLPESHEIVFINGRFCAELSRLDFPEGVTFSMGRGLSDASSLADLLQQEPFFQMNQAYGDGPTAVTLTIAPGTILSHPVHLLYLNAFKGTDQARCMTHPLNMVILGPSSKLKLVETYACAVDFPSDYFTNACTLVHLHQDAVLEHIKIQKEGRETLHLQSGAVSLDAGAVCSYTCFNFGAKLSRLTMKAALTGEEAQMGLTGLSELSDDQEADMVTTINHQAPHTSSNQLQKNILRDKAHAVFQGTIMVDRLAQKTKAKQLNKNLLLSPRAHVHTQPQLQIGADDVKCTHGATIGRMREDEVFYLESRGIPTTTAREMLTEAFAQEVKLAAQLKVPALAHRLSKKGPLQ